MAEKNPFWENVEERFQDFAPVALILLSVYLYDSFISTVLPKTWKSMLFTVVVGYFVLELVVKYLAVRDPKYFIYNYWLDILLVIPFFKSLKLFGAIGKSLKSLKSIKLLKYLPYTRKAIKLPKLVKKSKKSLKKRKRKLKKMLNISD
jgi:hypothetical protein